MYRFCPLTVELPPIDWCPKRSSWCKWRLENGLLSTRSIAAQHIHYRLIRNSYALLTWAWAHVAYKFKHCNVATTEKNYIFFYFEIKEEILDPHSSSDKSKTDQNRIGPVPISLTEKSSFLRWKISKETLEFLTSWVSGAYPRYSRTSVKFVWFVSSEIFKQ